MRKSEINRKTAETDISLSLVIDGNGVSEIQTGCGFMNHMLTLFACHGNFDLKIHCVGDTDVDFHHSVEDVGICLGKAFAEALADRSGINRYGDVILPMDEALVLCAADVSGRPFAAVELDITAEKVGDMDTELVEEFFRAFTNNAGVTLHIRKLAGKNTHHVIEAAFKAFARVMKTACTANGSGKILSTKGVL